MIVLDTGVVLAFLNAADRNHSQARAWVETVSDELVTTPLAVAEMDHLVARAGGQAGLASLYGELSAGAYGVEWWDGAMQETIAVAKANASMPLGLTDASLVGLAARLGTTSVATFDERHFRSLRPLTGEAAFRLLPADA